MLSSLYHTSATPEHSPRLTTGFLDSERQNKAQITWRGCLAQCGSWNWTKRRGLKGGPYPLGTRAPLLKVIISIAGLKEVSCGDVKGYIGKVRAWVSKSHRSPCTPGVGWPLGSAFPTWSPSGHLWKTCMPVWNQKELLGR